ncbi:MAG: nuclear transport factor 2 family protein [Acidimicrobiia bacterium]
MDSRDEAREIVRRLVSGYNDKDIRTLESLYAPDVQLWSSLGESRKGRGEVIAHLIDLFQRLPDEQMTAELVVTDGETVVVELSSRGSSPHGDYRIDFTEVLEVREGLVARIKTYIDPADVAAAEG